MAPTGKKGRGGGKTWGKALLSQADSTQILLPPPPLDFVLTSCCKVRLSKEWGREQEEEELRRGRKGKGKEVIPSRNAAPVPPSAELRVPAFQPFLFPSVSTSPEAQVFSSSFSY